MMNSLRTRARAAHAALRAREDRDRGASELITMIFTMLILVGIIWTMLEGSVYFNNRSIIEGLARDGARTVAINGGNGNALQATTIEKAYSVDHATACDANLMNNQTLATNTMTKVAWAAQKSSITPTECTILRAFANSSGIVNANMTKVSCTPAVVTAIGAPVACTVAWNYHGLPGSPLSFFHTRNGNGTDTFSLWNTVSKGTSESEVYNVGLIAR